MTCRTRNALAFAVFPLGLGACEAPADGAPPLIAVSNMLHPPFSSLDEDGRAVGMEVDLVAEAARRMGRDVGWVERPFGELLTAVAAGEADVAAATIGITEERARLVAFSRPYYSTTVVALVRLGEGEPTALDDLRGRKVGADRGTTAVDAVDARVPGAMQVNERPEGLGWAEMLSAGAIDAMVIDRSHAEPFMEAAGMRFAILDEPLREEPFAFALHPGASELRTVLDRVIAEYLTERRVRAPPGETAAAHGER